MHQENGASIGCGKLLLLLAAIAFSGPLGCSKRALYPEAVVTTSTGRPGACDFCRKRIEVVRDTHLVTIQGIQYIVCDETCAARQEQWVRSQ